MPIAEHQLNSIAWNKDEIDRAPVYCDICQSFDESSLENSLVLCHPTATRIQVAPNVAIPNPGLLALHQLPRLQDCYDESCSAHAFREAQD